MSFLGKIFGGNSGIEKELADTYIPMLSIMGGVSEAKAKKDFYRILKIVKKESKKEGTVNMPDGFGDYLLRNELTDQKIKVNLTKKRKEGVTDADIRWWWNMHDLERRMIQKTDDIFRLGTFGGMLAEGIEENVAANSVRKTYPIFGNPEDTSNASGDDRPLYYELKNRINIYIQNRFENEPEEFKSKLEDFSSFNAFIRYELSRENI